MVDNFEPFEVRRAGAAGGGDTLQDATNRRPLRYFPDVPEEFAGEISARPVGYDAVQVSLGSLTAGEGKYVFSSANLVGMALVRSSFGYPEHVRDGQVVEYVTDPADMPTTVLDEGLAAGSWYHYSLMLRYDGARWITAYRAEVLVPVDYAHRDTMYELLPPFYRATDDEPYRGSPNDALKQFFDVVGYDLDVTRTMAEGVQEVWNPDSAPNSLLALLGEQNLGVAGRGQVGDVRYRGLISEHRDINAMRGTTGGLRKYVEAATKFECEVTTGLNELLLVDDSEFAEGTGHWAPAPYNVAVALTGAPVTSTNVTITQLDSTGLPTTYREFTLDDPVLGQLDSNALTVF